MINEIARLTLGTGERRESSRLSSSVTNGGDSTASSQTKFGDRTLRITWFMFISSGNDIVRCESGPKAAAADRKLNGIESAVGKHQKLYSSVDKRVVTIRVINLHTYNDVNSVFIAPLGYQQI